MLYTRRQQEKNRFSEKKTLCGVPLNVESMVFEFAILSIWRAQYLVMLKTVVSWYLFTLRIFCHHYFHV